MNYYARPIVQKRTTYEPLSSSEQFVVPLLKRHINRIIDSYGVPASLEKQVLDVGCGGQPLRHKLESLGYHYTSVDVIQNPDKTVDVICAIDEPLPAELLASGPFQFILCTEVLEHVADWNMAFNNMVKLTAQGGYMLLTCPHFYPLHEEPYDFWRPTLYALRYFAHRSGLEVCEQVAAGDGWDVLGTLLANCSPSAGRPSLLSKLATSLTFRIKGWLFNALTKGRLRELVELRSTIYLSNIIVLQKPL